MEEIGGVLVDYEGVVVVVGRDGAKRQVILIVRDNAVVFRQISNFDIRNIHLIT